MKHTAERLSHHRILFLGLLDNHKVNLVIYTSLKKERNRIVGYFIFLIWKSIFWALPFHQSAGMTGFKGVGQKKNKQWVGGILLIGNLGAQFFLFHSSLCCCWSKYGAHQSRGWAALAILIALWRCVAPCKLIRQPNSVAEENPARRLSESHRHRLCFLAGARRRRRTHTNGHKCGYTECC
jgi:hypothetical protein